MDFVPPVSGKPVFQMNLFWAKYKLPIFTLLLAILIAVVFILSRGGKPLSLPLLTPTPVPAEGLGSEIYKEVSNPAENVSDANPFDAKVNPYEDTYKNPF